MEYVWKINTINAKMGDIRQLDPACPNTAILLSNSVIEPVENKATQPPEVKRGRAKKAVDNE